MKPGIWKAVEQYGRLYLAEHCQKRRRVREDALLLHTTERKAVLAAGGEAEAFTGVELVPEDLLETQGDELLAAVVAAVRGAEQSKAEDGKARFIAHIAADLLRGNEGEVNAEDVTRTVGLARLLVAESLKCAREE